MKEHGKLYCIGYSLLDKWEVGVAKSSRLPVTNVTDRLTSIALFLTPPSRLTTSTKYRCWFYGASIQYRLAEEEW